jgi:hypothetical protein
MGELKRLARAGDLQAGDMVQPPGTTEWMYVSEIAELKGLIEHEGPKQKGISGALVATLAIGFGGLFLAGAAATAWFASQMPSKTSQIVGDGGLNYSELLVTDDGVVLHGEPSATAASVGSLKKNESVQLLAKRGTFYKARTSGGSEGWVDMSQVLPIYQLGSDEVKAELDPLYNPDRYVNVANASWTQPQEQKDKDKLVTVFNFMIENNSGYPMTDLIMQVTIKDAKGHEVEVVQIPLQGTVEPRGTTMVGTLAPEAPKGKHPKPGEVEEPPIVLTESTFMEMQAKDPDLQLRYTAGAEVEMTTPEFTNATVDLLQLRAIPDDKAASEVSRAD